MNSYVSKFRVAWEAFWRVATTSAVALFVGGVTNAGTSGLGTALGDVDWWVALVAAAAAAGLRAVLPQPTDATGVGVKGVSTPSS